MLLLIVFIFGLNGQTCFLEQEYQNIIAQSLAPFREGIQR